MQTHEHRKVYTTGTRGPAGASVPSPSQQTLCLLPILLPPPPKSLPALAVGRKLLQTVMSAGIIFHAVLVRLWLYSTFQQCVVRPVGDLTKFWQSGKIATKTCPFKKLTYLHYRAVLHRAWLCHSISSGCPSACLSVSDVQVPWSHRLEYFENNFTAE